MTDLQEIRRIAKHVVRYIAHGGRAPRGEDIKKLVAYRKSQPDPRPNDTIHRWAIRWLKEQPENNNAQTQPPTP